MFTEFTRLVESCYFISLFYFYKPNKHPCSTLTLICAGGVNEELANLDSIDIQYIQYMQYINNIVKYKSYSSFPRTDIRTIHLSNKNICSFNDSNVLAPQSNLQSVMRRLAI